MMLLIKRNQNSSNLNSIKESKVLEKDKEKAI